MGTLILAKKLELAGFRVEIARYWNVVSNPKDNYILFRKEFISYLLTRSPKIISFYCRCEEYHICVDISNGIKQLDDSVCISFGGPQAELVAKETIERFPWVDFVCCSEGENTIVPFVSSLVNCNYDELYSIPGLTYRDSMGLVKQNLFPDFLPDNYVRNYQYYDMIPSSFLMKGQSVPIDVGRGCPFSCTYCSTKTFWKRKFRLRNIQNIIDEIEYVNKRFSIFNFDFMHDLFTVNKKRIISFCRELENRHLCVSWGCDSRIDTIDEEMIDLMCDTGLNRIFFGIESGSKYTQQVINKHLNLDKCERIVKYCLNKGISVTVSFIYGFPEETLKDVSDTIKMVVKFQNLGCTVLTNLCHIMNGTELHAKYKNSLFLSKDTAYNNCIIAFDDLYNLINNNKDIFSNFCDFSNEVREQMKYFDVFRYTMAYVHKSSIWNNCIENRSDYSLFKMYKNFCSSNVLLLEKQKLYSNGDVTNMRHILKNTPDEVFEELLSNLKEYYDANEE